mgnify:CR=1 FL=1
MVKIFSSIIAAIGRQLKQSVNVFQSLMLNRLLPACKRGIVNSPLCICPEEEASTHIHHRTRKCG